MVHSIDSGRGMSPPGSGGSGTRGGVRVAALLGRLETEIETLRKSDAQPPFLSGACSSVSLLHGLGAGLGLRESWGAAGPHLVEGAGAGYPVAATIMRSLRRAADLTASRGPCGRSNAVSTGGEGGNDSVDESLAEAAWQLERWEQVPPHHGHRWVPIDATC